MMLVDSTSCLDIWLTTDILRNAQKGPNSKSMLALKFCFISFFKGRWTSYFQDVFFAYSVQFFSFLRGGTIIITNICCNVPLSNVGSQDLNPHHLTLVFMGIFASHTFVSLLVSETEPNNWRIISPALYTNPKTNSSNRPWKCRPFAQVRKPANKRLPTSHSFFGCENVMLASGIGIFCFPKRPWYWIFLQLSYISIRTHFGDSSWIRQGTSEKWSDFQLPMDFFFKVQNPEPMTPPKQWRTQIRQVSLKA